MGRVSEPDHIGKGKPFLDRVRTSIGGHRVDKSRCTHSCMQGSSTGGMNTCTEVHTENSDEMARVPPYSQLILSGITTMPAAGRKAKLRASSALQGKASGGKTGDDCIPKEGSTAEEATGGEGDDCIPGEGSTAGRGIGKDSKKGNTAEAGDGEDGIPGEEGHAEGGDDEDCIPEEGSTVGETTTSKAESAWDAQCREQEAYYAALEERLLDNVRHSTEEILKVGLKQSMEASAELIKERMTDLMGGVTQVFKMAMEDQKEGISKMIDLDMRKVRNRINDADENIREHLKEELKAFSRTADHRLDEGLKKLGRRVNTVVDKVEHINMDALLEELRKLRDDVHDMKRRSVGTTEDGNHRYTGIIVDDQMADGAEDTEEEQGVEPNRRAPVQPIRRPLMGNHHRTIPKKTMGRTTAASHGKTGVSRRLDSTSLSQGPKRPRTWEGDRPTRQVQQTTPLVDSLSAQHVLQRTGSCYSYFTDGHCSRGDHCKFKHEVKYYD